MENRRRERAAARKRRQNIRMVTLALALVMLIGGVVGGTIAWLTDTTDPVVNTFTPSDIDIELAETKTDFKMVPGNTIEKDPKVTVAANSEACWLFVEVEESKALDEYVTYTIADGWTALPDVEGVYYRKVDASATAQTFSVLAGDQVTVKPTVTKEMMDAIDEDNEPKPSLSFTAYAIQQANVATDKTTDAEKAAAAWALINP